MGKSFELMGLAAFNIMLAVILSATFFGEAGTGQAGKLTKDNITVFIEEVSSISTGSRGAMDDYDITTFFMRHIAKDSTFKSEIRYQAPDMETSSREVKMGRNGYISNVIQGLHKNENQETKVVIEHITIGQDKKKANVRFTSFERGVLPYDDGFGEVRMVPVNGISYCEQDIIVNENKIIQMADADCVTDMEILNAF